MSQLRGKVKIFLKEKGFGFIYGDDGQEYFFHSSDVAGADIPQDGDIVTFEGGINDKGPKATQVHIKSKATKLRRRSYSDDREACSSCGKKMVPRLVFSRGVTDHSVCPFCGSTHKYFSHYSSSADKTGCLDVLMVWGYWILAGLGFLYLYLVIFVW